MPGDGNPQAEKKDSQKILLERSERDLCPHQLVQYLKEYDTDLSLFGKCFMQGVGESMEQQKVKCN